MRDPGKPTLIRQSDIIWAIVGAIKSCNQPQAIAAEIVRDKLSEAVKLVPSPPFGTRGPNRKLAKRLNAHLTDIEKAIRGADDGSRFALFVAAFYQGSKRPEELAEEDPKLDEWAMRLSADLAALNRGCEILLREPIGNYHASDHYKKLAAGVAFELLLELSPEPPVSSSPDNPLRAIATLIYEHLTGKQHVDLEAYCDILVRTLDLSLQKDRKINPDKS
jgi:hypothetical protein